MPQEKPEPVRLYAEEDRRLPRRVAAVLQAQIDVEVGALADGTDADFPAIRRRQGVIEGLRIALQACQDADKELSERR